MPLDLTVPTRRERALAWLRRSRGWLAVVALPTLAATIYYGAVAADLYASEARFVVRSPTRMPVGGIAGLLQTTGFNGSHDDVYSVQDFASSRDAMAALAKKIDLRAVFARPEADVLARYPNLFYDSTDEDFHLYLQRRIAVEFDTTTGISTITVKAFRAADAQLVAKLLLDESESLVNRLNERSRINAVRDAEEQVKLAEEHTAEIEKQLLAYRNRESMIDPGQTSGAVFKTLSGLQDQLATLRVQQGDLERRTPNSPLRAELQGRIDALEAQIGRETSRLAGSGGSMAPKLAEFEMLELRREFASKTLASAMGSLEGARADARSQQIYLDRVVEPNLPDKALFPKRLRNVVVVFVSCFLAWSTLRLLIAGVREHGQQ